MKYDIDFTNVFKKQVKKLEKRGKNLNKLKDVIKKLASDINLEEKYKDHQLVDDKNFRNCRECHIEPDWLLVYQYQNDKLILLLVETGSHSDLFK